MSPSIAAQAFQEMGCGYEAAVDHESVVVSALLERGWVVAPGSRCEMLCGECLKNYEGSETHDDAEKLGL